LQGFDKIFFLLDFITKFQKMITNAEHPLKPAMQHQNGLPY